MAISAQRDKTFQIRVTQDEVEMIEQKAFELGLTVSNYLRFVALHAKIEVLISKDTQKK